MKLISVSGPDGAGKSTFIRELKAHLETTLPGHEIGIAWMRYNPRAEFAPLRTRKVVSTLDERHTGHVLKRVLRRIGLKPIWIAVTARMYRRQLLLQLSALQTYDVVLADRYVFDFVADLIGAEICDLREGCSLVEKFPQPTISFVLTAEDCILDQRRNWREGLQALVDRRDLYLAIAERTTATVVDTLKDDWRRGLAPQLDALLTETEQ